MRSYKRKGRKPIDVRVPCSTRVAAIVAEWLENDYESKPATLLVPDAEEQNYGAASALAAILKKKAARKRTKPQFQCVVPRELAQWMLHTCFFLGDTNTPQVTAPPTVLAPVLVFALLCGEAAKANIRVGRPRLSRERLEKRVAEGTLQDGDVCEREIRRLRRRLERDRRIEEHLRNGHTLLTLPDHLH